MKNKCQVVMLATEKQYIGNCIALDDKTNELLRSAGESIRSLRTPQHLYIMSKVKGFDIPKGTWYYDTRDKCMSKSSLGITFFSVEIIATTDPELHKDGVAKIGLPFIEKYITEYNKGNVIKEVNVEYYFTHETGYDKLLNPKLREDGTVIIHKVQEVFTKEDLFSIIEQFKIYKILNSKTDNEFETWFEQNY